MAGTLSIEAMTEEALTTLKASTLAGDGCIVSFDSFYHPEPCRWAENGSPQAGGRATTGRGRAEEAGGRTYVFIIHDGIHSLTSHAYIYI